MSKTPKTAAIYKANADHFAELEKDRARLDWLIKQGPPGAATGQGLNEEVWDHAAEKAGDGIETDALAVRAAIDAARAE